MNYHAHIYFLPQQADIAENFRSLISKELFSVVQKISPLFNGPLGPHPIPTFEIHFEGVHLARVKDFLNQNRSGLSVLIHQDTGDDVPDHSENIEWLGKPVELDFGFFELILKNPELRINK